MPCSDVTEIIEVVVDPHDRVKSYEFTKRSCGQAVGAAELLSGILCGRTVEDVLAFDAETFLEQYPADEEILEFLSLKHLFAVQAALEVLTGKEPGGPGDPCAAADITFDGGDLVIRGQIAVDLVTEKIKSCGNCAKCGRGRERIVFQ